jgi:hypothetical protein
VSIKNQVLNSKDFNVLQTQILFNVIYKPEENSQLQKIHNFTDALESVHVFQKAFFPHGVK